MYFSSIFVHIFCLKMLFMQYANFTTAYKNIFMQK